MRQYRELAEVLEREVQVVPSSETEELFSQIVGRSAAPPVEPKREPHDVERRTLAEAAARPAMEISSSSSEPMPVELIARVAHCVESAVAECERHQWPAFVTNKYAEVCGANSVFQRLVGIDLRGTGGAPGERNLLSVASDPSFAEHLLNWDETLGTRISYFKASDVAPNGSERPDPYLLAVVERFLGGDPEYVNRLIRMWQEAPPNWERKEHWSYPILWRTSAGRILRFEGIVTSASFVERLTINDWIPLDGNTWRELRRLAEQGCTTPVTVSAQTDALITSNVTR